VVLAVIGGTAGALLATWGVVAARSWIPEGLLPRYVDVSVDVRALAFAMALSITVGVVCGLVPALVGSRLQLTESLKEGARTAVTGLGRIRRPGPQQLLVVAEVALALVLLAGAGLMLRSLERQLAVSPGFRPDGLLAARVTLPPRYTPEQRAAFAEQLAQRLDAMPSVAQAAVSSDLPLRGNTSAGRLLVDGGDAEGIRFYRHIVQPTFFTTLGVPIVAGRNFTGDDRRDAPAVVVVNQAMANRVWGGANAAIGRRVRLGGPQGPGATVVGVAGDARFRDLSTNLEAPGSEPDVYFPFGQRTDRDLDVAVRSRTSAILPVAAVREAVAAIDPLLSVYAARPLSEALHRQSATARFGSLVLGAFSVVAVLLAAIGIYGVVAFVVSLSRREIAIRIALGATGQSVSALIVRNGLALVAAGLVLGLLAAAAGTRFLSSQLFGVSPTDPLTFASVAALLALVAAVATYLPAHEAAGMEPQTVLKGD
jgi:predicted permease